MADSVDPGEMFPLGTISSESKQFAENDKFVQILIEKSINSSKYAHLEFKEGIFREV